MEILKKVDFILSCDLETTGLNPHDACWITGSFGILDAKTFQKVDEIELKSRPYHWDESARLVHGISKRTADQFPPREEALQALIDFIPKNRNFAFLCHASDSQFMESINQRVDFHFDFAMIKSDFWFQDRYFDFFDYFDHYKIISTVTLARAMKMESAKLNNLAKYFKIELNHHDAKSDRLACEEIFKRLMNDENSFSFGERDSKLDPGIFEIQENKGLEEQQRFNV